MSELNAMLVKLAEKLTASKKRIAMAESCTGGMVAAAITTLPGSSSWFECSFVTYSNEAKEKMLGVNTNTLVLHGAVSEQVVREMAQGAVVNSRADYAIAISGIAGPGGGTESKPVGTVWFGFAKRGMNGFEVNAECEHFSGTRDQVREAARDHALEHLIDIVS